MSVGVYWFPLQKCNFNWQILLRVSLLWVIRAFYFLEKLASPMDVKDSDELYSVFLVWGESRQRIGSAVVKVATLLLMRVVPALRYEFLVLICSLKTPFILLSMRNVIWRNVTNTISTCVSYYSALMPPWSSNPCIFIRRRFEVGTVIFVRLEETQISGSIIVLNA